MLKVFLILLNLIMINAIIMSKNPFLLGKFTLRSTNDPMFQNRYTYIVLNHDDTIKLKTVKLNNIFASKISRTGKIRMIRDNNRCVNNRIKNFILNSYIEENNIDIEINFNNINKYSYSFFWY